MRGLERTWLFLERGDATLQGDPSAPDLPDDLRMRLVEAREAERVRLAQEVHDGPAQALVNAIFQTDYIERVLDSHEQIRLLYVAATRAKGRDGKFFTFEVYL